MDFLKGLSTGAVICINDSLIRMAKNIKLFNPNVILMVPLMIETLAKKLEDAQGLPPEIVETLYEKQSENKSRNHIKRKCSPGVNLLRGCSLLIHHTIPDVDVLA